MMIGQIVSTCLNKQDALQYFIKCSMSFKFYQTQSKKVANGKMLGPYTVFDPTAGLIAKHFPFAALQAHFLQKVPLWRPSILKWSP